MLNWMYTNKKESWIVIKFSRNKALKTLQLEFSLDSHDRTQILDLLILCMKKKILFYNISIFVSQDKFDEYDR